MQPAAAPLRVGLARFSRRSACDPPFALSAFTRPQNDHPRHRRSPESPIRAPSVDTDSSRRREAAGQGVWGAWGSNPQPTDQSNTALPSDTMPHQPVPGCPLAPRSHDTPEADCGVIPRPLRSNPGFTRCDSPSRGTACVVSATGFARSGASDAADRGGDKGSSISELEPVRHRVAVNTSGQQPCKNYNQTGNGDQGGKHAAGVFDPSR